jgi:hypothetical protein
MNTTFGSDPEFMLVRDGRFFSAIGIVSGTKTCRLQQNGHEFYYDNVMAECAIKPSSSKEETLHNFRECFKHYAKLVKPYKLTPQASYNYHSQQLLHKDARDVGCKTEYCAYMLQELKDENTIHVIKRTNFRSAGGHIHLGSKSLQDSYNQAFTVRMLDLFLGLPLVFIDRDDTAPMRREMYGKAGRHRRPAHGLEYRTPGNYWLSSPRLVELVYDLCMFSVKFVEAGRHYKFWRVGDENRPDYWNAHQCFGYDLQQLRNAIDHSNLPTGEKFLHLIRHHLPVQLMRGLADAAEDRNKCDFYQEWGL